MGKKLYLTRRKSSIPYRRLGFALCKTGFQLLNLLPVSFDESIRVNHFCLLGMQLKKKKSFLSKPFSLSYPKRRKESNLNAFHSLRESQRTQSFRQCHCIWTNRTNNTDPCISIETRLQHTCQFRIAIRDMISFMFGRVFGEGTDDSAQSKQRGIDIFAFTCAIFGGSRFLRPSEIDETLI